MAASYDSIVVGAGSAGCVIAARLTEDPDHRVLLVEAGPDYPTSTLPAVLSDAWVGPHTMSHDWQLSGVTGAGNPEIPLPRGRVTGGCSATNGTFALRGSRHDYDAWAAAGNPGWSFAEVLPYFVRSEHDLDYATQPWHGDGGPLPIRRYRGEERSPAAVHTLAALLATGTAAVEDHNRPDVVGAGPLPVNAVAGRRMSTAATYLESARRRPNLTVRADTTVSRIVIRDGRAVGVAVGVETLGCGRVVVCAGAYLSPVLLLRSGIGPATALSALGVDVLLDLAGVGENLADHPWVAAELPFLLPVHPTPRFQLVATRHSSTADPVFDPPDLQLFLANPEVGGDAFIIAGALLKPRSRGHVRLRSADPTVDPEINLGYFSHPADEPRLAEGLRWVRQVGASAELAPLTGGGPVGPAAAVADDDAALGQWLRESAWTYHHPVGTCAMGPEPDAGAVVDAQGRVYGVDGLVVADASVMPEIPSANTNLPTIMLAERLAAMLRGEAPLAAVWSPAEGRLGESAILP